MDELYNCFPWKKCFHGRTFYVVPFTWLSIFPWIEGRFLWASITWSPPVFPCGNLVAVEVLLPWLPAYQSFHLDGLFLRSPSCYLVNSISIENLVLWRSCCLVTSIPMEDLFLWKPCFLASVLIWKAFCSLFLRRSYCPIMSVSMEALFLWESCHLVTSISWQSWFPTGAIDVVLPLSLWLAEFPFGREILLPGYQCFSRKLVSMDILLPGYQCFYDVSQRTSYELFFHVKHCFHK